MKDRRQIEAPPDTEKSRLTQQAKDNRNQRINRRPLTIKEVHALWLHRNPDDDTTYWTMRRIMREAEAKIREELSRESGLDP